MFRRKDLEGSRREGTSQRAISSGNGKALRSGSAPPTAGPAGASASRASSGTAASPGQLSQAASYAQEITVADFGGPSAGPLGPEGSSRNHSRRTAASARDDAESYYDDGFSEFSLKAEQDAHTVRMLQLKVAQAQARAGPTFP